MRLRPIEGLEELRRPITVVQGGDDEFGSPEELRIRLARLEPPGELEVAPISLNSSSREVALSESSLAASASKVWRSALALSLAIRSSGLLFFVTRALAS